LPRLEPIRVDQVRSGNDVPYRPFVVNDFRRGDLSAFGRIRMNRSGFLLPESLDVDGPVEGHVVEAGTKGIPCPGLLDEEFCPVSEVFLEGFVRRVLDLHFDGVLHPHEAPHQPGDDVVDSDPDDRNDDVRGPRPGEGLLLVLRLRTVGSRQTGELLLPLLVNFESSSKLAVDVLDQLSFLLFGQFNVDRFELRHGGRLLPGSEDTGLQYRVSAARCSESVPPTPASRLSYGLSRPHAWHGHAPHRHLSLSASLLAQSSRHDSSSSSVPRNATARGETTFFVSHGTANPIHVSPFFCFHKAEERQASCCRVEEVHRSSDWKGLEFVDEVLDARGSLSTEYHVRFDVGSQRPNACVLRTVSRLFGAGEGLVNFEKRRVGFLRSAYASGMKRRPFWSLNITIIAFRAFFFCSASLIAGSQKQTRRSPANGTTSCVPSACSRTRLPSSSKTNQRRSFSLNSASSGFFGLFKYNIEYMNVPCFCRMRLQEAAGNSSSKK